MERPEMAAARFPIRPYLLLLSGATIWMSCIWLAPLGLSLGRPEAGVLYLFFHPICHQLPERSFFLAGFPLAVCHRCFGLYFGFWLGVALLPLARGVSARIEANPRIVVALAAPMLIDVFWGGLAVSRFATGLLAAFPFASLVWLALRQFTETKFFTQRKRT